jgi:hypothetical protein
LIDFHKEFRHINFIAFLATSAKNEYIEKENVNGDKEEELANSKKIFIIIKMSQNSLDTSTREHINISYLLNYNQKFICSMD